MAPSLGFGGSEYRIQWLSIAVIIIVAYCIDIFKSAKNTKFADLQLTCTIISVYYNCKTAKKTKFADLKNIEVGQRILWYIIFRIKKTSPEKTLLLPFRRKIKIKGKTQEDIIFRSYWRMGIFIA